MSENPDLPSQPKKSILDLLPAKAPAETSVGTLYVRHARVSDWAQFESDDPEELGRTAVQQLVSRVENKDDTSPLPDEDFNSLGEIDFAALAPVIAKKSDWEEVLGPPGLKSLGQAIKAAKDRERKRHKKTLEDMQRSIGGSYAFLNQGTLKKLQDQVAGLDNLRKSLSGTEALRQAMRTAGLENDVLKNHLASTRAIRETMGDFERLHPSPTIEATIIDVPRIHIPRQEDTPVGRAAIENAENSREVVAKVDALVEIVGGLNQTLVTEVLPSWIRQVEEDQKNAKESFAQAANGLWWTKWAVIASVVVTALVAGWEIWAAYDIDRDNSAQQKKTEALLHEQLAMQKKLIEQQTQDAAKLREQLEKQTKAFEKIQQEKNVTPKSRTLR
jgi:hypothetical protein